MKKGLILILTIGVFSIINTEMGVVGILPLVSENYGVTVAGELWSDSRSGRPARQYVRTGRSSIRTYDAAFFLGSK